MKTAFVLFCLFGVLAHADTSARIRSALDRSGALNKVTDKNDCRKDILDLVSGCSVELFPGYKISDFLLRLLRVEGGSFKIRDDVLSKALKNFKEDPKKALTIGGCCGAACEIAKKRCLCDKTTFEALKNLLGEEAVALMEQFKDTCVADNKQLKFGMTIFGAGGCGRRGKRAAKKFVCGA